MNNGAELLICATAALTVFVRVTAASGGTIPATPTPAPLVTATPTVASIVMDLSGFQQFEFFSFSEGFCLPETDTVARADITRSGDQYQFQFWTLREGTAGIDNCIEYLPPWPECLVWVPHTARPLTRDETQQVQSAFSAIVIDREPDPTCFVPVIEECVVPTFQWDGFSVDNFICHPDHLDPKQAETISYLLNELAGIGVCAGDCDGSGDVGISEVITMVNIALGNADLSRCIPGDANGDGTIAVNEIIAAVNNALNGCPAPAG